MQFRKDINGLRAIAVVSVVLFHFFPDLLPGGFVGVDIFFVISGYLMTSIIVKGIHNKNFNTLNFYVARANRIIPALFFLCLVLTIWGWIFLSPQDLKLLSKHVGSSISFLSNMIYLGESGYFDTASKTKWLLHTWSLSVEWQFYIIYPLVLITLSKFFPWVMFKYSILVLTLIGFIVNLIYSYIAPEFAYFSLATRSWEMMTGSIAFLFPLTLNKKTKIKTAYVGLLLLLLSCVFLSEDFMWPSYYALVPILGTFLIMQANLQDNIFTDNKFSQVIGKWSYSIYLWHWPIVVGFLYFEFAGLNLLLGLLMSILCGFFSYRYIESIRFKKRDFNVLSLYKSISIWLVLIIGGISSNIFLTNGALWHYSDEVKDLNGLNTSNPYRRTCFSVENFGCFFNANGNIDKLDDLSPDLVLIGDSHSFAILPMLVETAALNNKTLMYFGSSACLPVPNLIAYGYKIDVCNKKLEYFYDDFLKKHPNSNILVSSRFPIYFAGYNEGNYSDPMMDVRLPKNSEFAINDLETNRMDLEVVISNHFCSLAEEHNISIMTTGPEFGINIPNEITKSLMKGKKQTISLPTSEYKARNYSITKMLSKISQECGVNILEIKDYLCDEYMCPASVDGTPLYKDDDHLSYEGTKLLTPLFNNIFQI